MILMFDVLILKLKHIIVRRIAHIVNNECREIVVVEKSVVVEMPGQLTLMLCIRIAEKVIKACSNMVVEPFLAVFTNS